MSLLRHRAFNLAGRLLVPPAHRRPWILVKDTMAHLETQLAAMKSQ